MAERDQTTERDERHVGQEGKDHSRRDDERAREAFENPLRKAAEPDRSGTSDTVAWFLKPLPIALIAVVLVILFAVMIL